VGETPSHDPGALLHHLYITGGLQVSARSTWNLTEERQIKIAVIGATEPTYQSPEVRVECFPWNRLKKVANLADYDVVILDLLSLREPEELDVLTFSKVLDIRTAQQVLSKNGGAIFVLGDPRFTVKWESASAEHEEPFLNWTGIKFSWDERPGTTVERAWEASSGPYKPFVDRLVRWEYSLDQCRPYLEEFKKAWNVNVMLDQGEEPSVEVVKFCWNRYGNALVFAVRHAYDEVSNRGTRFEYRETTTLSGPIIFLPKVNLSEEETLERVLRDLLGVEVSAPEPAWIAEFKAPGQEEVDQDLAELEARIEELIGDHDRKVEERSQLREPLKLLYETGPPLEEAARSVMESLGAQVEWSREERDKADGWVTVRVGDQTFEGVLEVKGVKTKHFGFEALRQLTDWVHHGVSSRRKKYTGIFVGNSSREDPPRRRIWPFNPNWVEQAEMHGYAAVLTRDLYALYLLDRTGRLDRDEFWRQLFSTKGPFTA
jgi:hypothetical protein